MNWGYTGWSSFIKEVDTGEIKLRLKIKIKVVPDE